MKFMQSLDDQFYRRLEKIAKERGTTVQNLIRAVIIPEWQTRQRQKARKRRLKKWRGRK